MQSPENPKHIEPEEKEKGTGKEVSPEPQEGVEISHEQVEQHAAEAEIKQNDGTHESRETNRQISNIHFLVHPGYIVNNELEHHYENMDTLLESYITKASTLKPEELMVIFAPTAGRNFLRDMRQKDAVEQDRLIAYTKVISQIKQLLGERLIVLSFDGETEAQNKERIWDRIKNVAQKRGFAFSDQLTGEAYGEYVESCVQDVATNMHQASGMSQSVEIKAGITDFKLDGEQSHTQRESLEKYKRPNTNIDYTDTAVDQKK